MLSINKSIISASLCGADSCECESESFLTLSRNILLPMYLYIMYMFIGNVYIDQKYICCILMSLRVLFFFVRVGVSVSLNIV